MDLVTGHLYISADTIVVSDGKIFNKPQDLTEAETMLRSYFGKSHHVVTSVCLRTSHSLDVFIRLHRLILWTIIQPLKRLFSHISVKRPLDKAGAYGIQELDPRFVAGISGDIHTIIGLPVAEVSRRIFSEEGFEK